jgi:hypothetical protein
VRRARTPSVASPDEPDANAERVVHGTRTRIARHEQSATLAAGRAHERVVDRATRDAQPCELGTECGCGGVGVTLLFGGARIPLDFTGLVGGAHAATINYSTVAELVEADPEVADTIHQPVDPAIVERLSATFEDFRRGMQLGALTPEEFEGFGPVQHFRDAFIAGWHGVLGAVALVRAETAAPVA